MLSFADAQLAARDPGIPALATLLDPEALAAKIRPCFPDAPLAQLRARYARYKPGTSCLVAYTVESCAGETVLYAKAYRKDAPEKLSKARRRMGFTGPLGRGGVALNDIGVAVYVHPNDRELPALAGLSDSHNRAVMLADLLPDRPDLTQSGLRRLHYKPERRFVARLEGDKGSDALVRIYNQGDYPGALSAARAFASQKHLRVARVLGESDRKRMLVLDWLSGQPLDEACADPAFDPGRVEQVAAALAELHSQPANSLAVVTPEAQARELLASADAIAVACPQLAKRARYLAGRLTSRRSESWLLTRPIHGDFSADQVLLQDDSVGIIDFDAARRGDPAADLGSFAAHLQREVVRNNLPYERAEAMVSELLEGYRKASGSDPTDRFPLHLAVALLHLASSPFRYRELDWPQKAQILLEQAEEAAANV